MKVIDLLNKIGNQESVPNRILVDGKYFDWNSLEMFYQTENKEDLLELSKKYSTWDFLNFSVVEIPQMDTHIDIDIQSIEELDVQENQFNTYNKALKINELIQAIKQLDRQINNK